MLNVRSSLCFRPSSCIFRRPVPVARAISKLKRRIPLLFTAKPGSSKVWIVKGECLARGRAGLMAYPAIWEDRQMSSITWAFANPSGVLYLSPGLRGPCYPGGRDRNDAFRFFFWLGAAMARPARRKKERNHSGPAPRVARLARRSLGRGRPACPKPQREGRCRATLG